MRSNASSAAAACIVLLLSLAGCTQDTVGNIVAGEHRIHIVGDHGSWQTAFYWNGGDLSVLDEPDGEFHVRATSVTVSNGVVYVGGSYDGRPCYWEDAIRRDIACESGAIEAIAADDADRLVLAGVCDGEGSVWIEGVRSALPVPTGHVCEVSAMVSVGEAVYVAGTYRTTEWEDKGPCYWHDGERRDLPAPPSTATGGSVLVSGIASTGDSIYISGNYDADDADGGAGYWVDGEWNDLDGTATRAIAVAEDGVYVAGRDADRACYWHNGQKIELWCDFSTIATAVAVAGGKCGSSTQPEHIGYWMPGGEFTQIYERNIADINAIYVEE